MLRRLLLALMVAWGSSAIAADLPPKIVLKVGSATTSSWDLIARTVQTHMVKHLPGNPEIVVETVDSGRGMQLARQLATTEPTDGSVAAFSSMSIIHGYVTDRSTFDFSVEKTIWVGALAKSVSFCVVKKDAGVTLKDDGLLVGAVNKTSDFYRNGQLLKNLVNPSIQVILGFKGENELMAALDRGEIGMYCGPTRSTYIREGRESTQTVVGGVGNPETLAALGVDDVFAGVSPEDRSVIDFSQFQYSYFYAMALPAGTAPDIVKIYRDAFSALNQDPEFIADIKAKVPDYKHTEGEALQAAVAAELDTDPAILARYAELTK